MRIRHPATVFLQRAQVILILSALVPTILTTPLGILLLASGDPGRVEIVTGVLVLAFAASSVTGFIIGGILFRRGSALVRIQSDFLSSVSHELRTPMTSMRMFVEALLDDRLTDKDERANCLQVLRREIDRLDGLVGRLIELSRLETDKKPYDRIVVDVGSIVDNALSALDAIQLTDTKRVQATVEDSLQVMGDDRALVQVLTNLLSNAWKYSGSDSGIQLIVRAASDKEVEFIVQDDGPGIPADEQKRVFEKFWRGQYAIESGTSGSGLGLAVVQAIVEAHRGRIRLRSPSGGGTAFHVFLPRHKS